MKTFKLTLANSQGVVIDQREIAILDDLEWERFEEEHRDGIDEAKWDAFDHIFSLDEIKKHRLLNRNYYTGDEILNAIYMELKKEGLIE